MLVPTTLFGLSGWRWVIIFGALFSLAIWFIRKKLPESARWLESKGRHDDAHTVMCEMEARCGLTPSPKHAHAAQSVVKRGTFREIWAPQYRQRTLMLMVMNFFQAIGFFGFGNWLPALLSGQGASITHSLLYAFFITLAYPLGCLFCTRFVHRFENKWQIVLSALMTVIFGTLFALQNSPILLVICGFMITVQRLADHQLPRLPGRGLPDPYSRPRRRLLLLVQPALDRSDQHSDRHYSAIRRHAGVISFIVVSMLMVMLSVGIFGPRTRGIRLENI